MAVDIDDRRARGDIRISTDGDRALGVDGCAVDTAAFSDFDTRPRRVYQHSHRLDVCMVAKIAGAQDRVSMQDDLSAEDLDVGTPLYTSTFLELHALEGSLSSKHAVSKTKHLCTGTIAQTRATGSLQAATSSRFASTLKFMKPDKQA